MTAPSPSDDRLHVLLDQIEAIWELLDARLCERQPFGWDGGSKPLTLTDDEYLWEPVADCWSLRRTGEGGMVPARGKGEWRLESVYPAPQPPPFTTIAWRMCHVAAGLLMRYDYTFGTHSITTDDIAWPSTAQSGVAFLREQYLHWHDGIAGVTSAELDQIGRSQFPHGLDPHVRFVDLLAWVNVEFAHHAAEIGCLRDLYRHRNSLSAPDRETAR